MTFKRALLINVTENSTQTVKIHNELQKRYSDIKIISKDTPVRPQRTSIIRGILNLITTRDAELCLYWMGDGLVPEDEAEKGPITFSQFRGLLSFVESTSKLVVIMDITSKQPLELTYNLGNHSRIITEKKGDRFVRMRKDFPIIVNAGRMSELPDNIVLFSGYMSKPTLAYESGNFMGGISFCLFLALKEEHITFSELLEDIKQKLNDNGYPQTLNFATSCKDAFEIEVSKFF